jgi:hypothetical protein
MARTSENGPKLNTSKKFNKSVIVYCCDGVRLRLCRTGPLIGLLSILQMTHE